MNWMMMAMDDDESQHPGTGLKTAETVREQALNPMQPRGKLGLRGTMKTAATNQQRSAAPVCLQPHP